MNELSVVCISTMNYIFLRAITGKEIFSETIISELGMYIKKLVETIKNGNSDECYKINCIINHELANGYIKNLKTFKNLLILFFQHHKEIEVSEEEWADLMKYYITQAEYIMKRGE